MKSNIYNIIILNNRAISIYCLFYNLLSPFFLALFLLTSSCLGIELISLFIIFTIIFSLYIGIMFKSDEKPLKTALFFSLFLFLSNATCFISLLIIGLLWNIKKNNEGWGIIMIFSILLLVLEIISFNIAYFSKRFFLKLNPRANQ